MFQVVTAPEQVNIIKVANKLGDVTTMIRCADDALLSRLGSCLSLSSAFNNSLVLHFIKLTTSVLKPLLLHPLNPASCL